MTHPAPEALLRAVVDSGTASDPDGPSPRHHEAVEPTTPLRALLAVIAAGSAARDLRLGDEKLSRLVQARDKLAHVYSVDEILPGYVSSLIETRVRPAVERARELLGEQR